MSFALVTAWLVLALAIPVSAQDAGFPPLPMLFDGSVVLNGEPVAEGQLTVRIGDWESGPVAVVDGVFRCANPCLIAGPPDFSYIGEPVTFHLDGGEPAGLSFAFLQAASPSRMSVELVFETGFSMLVIGLAIAGAVVATAAAAAYVVRRRARRSVRSASPPPRTR
jgi:hypothetical protein